MHGADFLAEEEGRFESAPDGQGIKTITDIQVKDGKKVKVCSNTEPPAGVDYSGHAETLQMHT